VGYERWSDRHRPVRTYGPQRYRQRHVHVREVRLVRAPLAWNWRDEYLILANQGASRNPYYVEDYDQWDLSVSYTLDDHWSSASRRST
jgi:hypothetical protein